MWAEATETLWCAFVAVWPEGVPVEVGGAGSAIFAVRLRSRHDGTSAWTDQLCLHASLSHVTQAGCQ